MIRQPALIDFFKKQAIFMWQVNFFPACWPDGCSRPAFFIQFFCPQHTVKNLLHLIARANQRSSERVTKELFRVLD